MQGQQQQAPLKLLHADWTTIDRRFPVKAPWRELVSQQWLLKNTNQQLATIYMTFWQVTITDRGIHRTLRPFFPSMATSPNYALITLCSDSGPISKPKEQKCITNLWHFSRHCPHHPNDWYLPMATKLPLYCAEITETIGERNYS